MAAPNALDLANAKAMGQSPSYVGGSDTTTPQPVNANTSGIVGGNNPTGAIMPANSSPTQNPSGNSAVPVQDANGQYYYPSSGQGNFAPAGSTPASGSAGAAAYATGAGFTPPDSEATIQQNMLTEAQSQIDAINAQFSATIQQDQVAAQNAQTDVNASAARMGLMGSPQGASMLGTAATNSNAITAGDQAKQAAALAAVYSTVDSNAQAQANLEQSNAETNSQDYLKQQQQIASTAQAQIAQLAQLGVTSSSIQANDPALWDSLQSQSGYSAYQLQVSLDQNPSNPNAKQTTQTYVPDPSDPSKTTVKRISIDPTTGQSTETDYSINVPYANANPNAFKIVGTNLYYADPTTGNLVLQDPYKTLPAGSAVFNTQTGTTGAANNPKYAAGALGSSTYLSSGGGQSTGSTTNFSTNQTATPGTASSGATTAPAEAPAGTLSSAQVWAGLPAQDQKSVQALGLTPDALYNAAWLTIANGGTPPAGGMGVAGQLKGSAISDAMSKILSSMGLAATDLPAIGALTSGYTSSLNQQITMQGSINQYLGQATNNLKVLQQQIANYPDSTNSPLVNSVIQWSQNNVDASPSFNGFQTSLFTFLNEYAKIMQGSTGSVSGATVSSQKEASEMLNTEMSKGSLSAAIGVMQKDIQGKLNSVQSNIQNISSNLANTISNYAQNKSGGGNNLQSAANTQGTYDDATGGTANFKDLTYTDANGDTWTFDSTSTMSTAIQNIEANQ